MKFKKQVSVLGGVVLFGSIAVPGGQAFAFGQQWRPAPGLATTQGQSYQRVANVPRFRPHAAAEPQPRQHQSRPYSERYAAASPRYALTQRHRPVVRPVDPHHAGHLPRHYAPPAWVQPFSGMAQLWQPPMPVFGRQIAWQAPERPVAPRWMVPEPAERWAEPRSWEAPRNANYRPSVVERIPMAGSWRPAMGQRYAARQPVRAIYPQAAARLASRVDRPSGFNAVRHGRLSTVAAQWRPAIPPVGSARDSEFDFRPDTYGRNLSNSARVAANSGAGAPYRADALPGFVTTHRDRDAGYACTWCSGS
jgi:hypothetical protein